MGENSKIEWCHHTFNPWVGCQKVSDGCKFCYAEEMMDKRYGKVEWGQQGTRQRTSDSNWRLPLSWNRRAEREGVRFRVFCASLADVFEDRAELIPWRQELFSLIEKTPHLDWLLLTKRPENINDMVPAQWRNVNRWPLNVWVGTSVEDQEQAEKRIGHLVNVPARIRFLSCEPLLGPIDLESMGCFAFHGSVLRLPALIHWVIVGGESGRHARPMHPDWARSLRDQCQAAGVPYLFKQWGEWAPVATPRQNHGQIITMDGNGSQNPATWADVMIATGDVWGFERVGKHAAGRLLDGVEWSEFPG